jgi:protein tyrosine phosphatase
MQQPPVHMVSIEDKLDRYADIQPFEHSRVVRPCTPQQYLYHYNILIIIIRNSF